MVFAIFCAVASLPTQGQTASAMQTAPKVERLVLLKVDGLPQDVLAKYLTRGDADGSSSRLPGSKLPSSKLPWIQTVFGNGGVILDNFYSRGVSLSTTGWSQLDTGQPSLIRGNVEYDRYTLRPYDYLNFFPFYLGYATASRVDMPGVELLDEYGIPLLLDRFPHEQRFQGFQLLQRGVNWGTLQSTLTRTITSRSPQELLDQLQIGLSVVGEFHDQGEAELLAKIADPNIKYLDHFVSEYDHTAHTVRDPISQLHILEELDSLVGRVWAAIQASPLAGRTLLVLVSDHGMNTSEDVYSQGYNFVDWFASAAGGRHHVLTNRHPLTEFTLKGLDPLVAAVVTPSENSPYAESDAEKYPTVMLDLDGNERASIGLRSNTFNQIHLLLDALQPGKIAGATRVAALNTLFEILDAVRADWQQDLTELRSELEELTLRTDRLQEVVEQFPKSWSAEQITRGVHRDARRTTHRMEIWRDQIAEYARYLDAMSRLLRLTPADFDPGKFKVEELVPPRSLGPANSIADLQHYVTGVGPEGLLIRVATDSQGNQRFELDWERSFRTVNYFDRLSSLSVKNVVQEEVGRRPVDFTAVRVPREDLLSAWPSANSGGNDLDEQVAGDEIAGDGVWLRSSEDRQSLLLSRIRADGERELRYIPISGLTAEGDPTGQTLRFNTETWDSDFPLQLFEDPELAVDGDREAWLSTWHTEREWFEAVHRTRYSNGIVDLIAQIVDETISARPDAGPFETFLNRKTKLRRTDLLVLANDHWNFNVRGFNPGGNHGSFFRASTHSVLMFAGGQDTGIVRGSHIEKPYDSLSLVPTVLDLMGRPEPDLPGAVIQEITNSQTSTTSQ